MARDDAMRGIAKGNVLPRVIQQLHAKIVSLLRESVDIICQNDIDLRDIYEGLHDSLPGVIQWFFICLGDASEELRFQDQQVNIRSIEKTEDSLWGLPWGLKGVIDVFCEVSVHGRKMHIPVEIKTGAEDAISHNVQISLYSILASQRERDSDFILSRPGALSGFLVYLKSNSVLPDAPPNPTIDSEIKTELETGRRGSYIMMLLQHVKKQIESMQKKELRPLGISPTSSLTVRPKSLDVSHIRSFLIRRNLLVAYIEQEQHRKQSACDGDIEDLPVVPDVCSNPLYCETCGYLPLCSSLAREDRPKESSFPLSTIPTNHVVSHYGRSLTLQSIAYFRKWVHIPPSRDD